MFKKCLTAILTCSLVTAPLKTEETSKSYLKQLWNSFAKKVDTITRYGDRDYMRAFVVSSICAVPLGFQLWASRNDMIENLVYDAHGKLTSNQDELFAWLKKLNDAGGATVQAKPNGSFTKWKWTSDTGESFVHEFASKLEPVTSDLNYKIFFGMASIAGIIALYSAYKLLNTPDKTDTEVIT